MRIPALRVRDLRVEEPAPRRRQVIGAQQERPACVRTDLRAGKRRKLQVCRAVIQPRARANPARGAFVSLHDDRVGWVHSLHLVPSPESAIVDLVIAVLTGRGISEHDVCCAVAVEVTNSCDMERVR